MTDVVHRRHILLTGAQTALGRALSQALAATHRITPLPDEDLADRSRITRAAASVDTIIHLVHEAPDMHPDRERDALDRATRGSYDLLTAANPDRFILVSSLRPMSHYPASLLVDEHFQPQPTTRAEDLVPYLAELTVREVSRVQQVEVIVLRLGEVVDPAQTPVDTRSALALHIEDAVQSVMRGLAFAGNPEERPTRFHLFHITDGGTGSWFRQGAAWQPAFGYRPQYQLTNDVRIEPTSVSTERSASPAPSPIRRLTIFGAYGPLSAAATMVLASTYTLRLTDLRPVEDLASIPPQSPGAPLPQRLGPPHEHQVVNVANLDQVLAAAQGAQALLNCAVVRQDPVAAFQVNVIGALNIMQAAVAHGIRRIVHTGPLLTLLRHPAGYDAEFGLVDDLPPRPGDDLYFVSKFLGQEICRIFAEAYGLEVPALLFCNFVEPSLPPRNRDRFFPFAVSWSDSAQAILRAVDIPQLPRPFEILHILADLPHGKYTNAKAKFLLDWQPQDSLADYWQRDR